MRKLLLFTVIFVPPFCFCWAGGTHGWGMTFMFREAVHESTDPLRGALAQMFNKMDKVVRFASLGHERYTVHLIDRILRGVSVDDVLDPHQRRSFRAHVASVQDIDNVLKHRDRMPRDLLQTSCFDYVVHDYPGWIYDEMNGKGNIRPLIETFGDVRTENDFVTMAAVVLLTQIKASILGEECMTVVFGNGTNAREGVERYGNVNLQNLRGMIEILRREARRLDGEINLLDDVKPYVMEYSKKNWNLESRYINAGVYKYVSVKYFWRQWLIVTINKNSSNFHQGYPGSNHSIIIEGADFVHTVFIATSGPRILDKVKPTLDCCFFESTDTPDISYCRCPDYVKVLQSCLGRDIRALFCLTDIDRGAWSSPSLGYRRYNLLPGGDCNVILVP